MNIPNTNKKKVVIIGAGFAGIELAKELSNNQEFQVTIIDKNNFHQFQPLLYQVATAGLEPSSISFPLRKLFQDSSNIFIRVAEVLEISADDKFIITDKGIIEYDTLVISTGTTTNYFGNEEIAKNSLPMKTVQEALDIRNTILKNYEEAIIETDSDNKKSLLNIVVVGGGPTGVEISGALADMKRFVLPKDMPELDVNDFKITLIEASPNVLNVFSKESQVETLSSLKRMGVDVLTNSTVLSYDGEKVIFKKDGTYNEIPTKTLIWAVGVKPNSIKILSSNSCSFYNQIGKVTINEYLESNIKDIYACGDISTLVTDEYPRGLPQLASVAKQMGSYLGKRLSGKTSKKFKYVDRGVMATIGRNSAVVDIGKYRFKGVFAWFLWMAIHLVLLVGAKNKLFVFINWLWGYVTFDQNLRLIIDTKKKCA